jgi:iron complex transport system substrate-binding protein
MSAIADAETIVGWNPDHIIATNRQARDAIMADPALATVAAVRNAHVAVCPSGIFLWSVRSGEGAMMPLWLGTILHPELFADIDMRAVVRDFFRDFYRYEAPDEEIERILAGG